MDNGCLATSLMPILTGEATRDKWKSFGERRPTLEGNKEEREMEEEKISHVDETAAQTPELKPIFYGTTKTHAL
jgi:hypothetical protein